MIGNAIDRKAIMYATIRAIESDFIQTFATLLTLDDIPKAVLDRSNRVTTEQNILLSYLRQHRTNDLLSRKSISTMKHDWDTPLKCLHVRTNSSRQT